MLWSVQQHGLFSLSEFFLGFSQTRHFAIGTDKASAILNRQHGHDCGRQLAYVPAVLLGVEAIIQEAKQLRRARLMSSGKLMAVPPLAPVFVDDQRRNDVLIVQRRRPCPDRIADLFVVWRRFSLSAFIAPGWIPVLC